MGNTCNSKNQSQSEIPQKFIVLSLEISVFEFSHIIQSWQYWHFCKILNGNKLEIVANWIKSTTNLHWSWCFKLILKSLIIISNRKMPTLPTLCISGKLDLDTETQTKNKISRTTDFLVTGSNYFRGACTWPGTADLCHGTCLADRSV